MLTIPLSIGIRRLVGRISLLVILAVVGLVLAGCRPSVRDQGKKDELLVKCGHCLDFPTGEVCTPEGTRRNSCQAICEGVKILCSQACPCTNG